MTNEEIDKAYFSLLSYELHADLIRLIASKCKDAVDECSVYRKERANNLSPYVRRTQIEENVELLVKEDYPEINCFVRPLGTNNCVTELRRDFVLLTVHKVANRNSKVRSAVQRKMLAQSAQAHLFEANELPPADAILYAQLKYGIAKGAPRQLAFAVVDFLDEHENIVHSINLLARPEFASLLEETSKETRIENINDDLDIGLRSDAKNKGRKGGIIGPQQESQSNTNNAEENKDEN